MALFFFFSSISQKQHLCLSLSLSFFFSVFLPHSLWETTKKYKREENEEQEELHFKVA
jgi:hypothetical protein